MSDTVPADADRFVRPSIGWYLLLEPGIGAVAVLSASRSAYEAAAAAVPLPSRRTVQAIAVGTLAVHVGEGVYAYRRARAAGLTRSAARWGVETFAVGFPALLSLRRTIAAAAAG